MTHYIRTSRPRRATAVDAHPTFLDPSVTLIQWHYNVDLVDSLGYRSVLHSFRSIVTRPGQPGLWLDTPYYCASGPHRYRRLPRGLERRLRIAALRGRLIAARTRLANCAAEVLNSASKCIVDLALSPLRAIQRRRERRNDPFAALFDELK
jgi:hypothetical protein